MYNIFFLLSKYIGVELLLTKKLPVFWSGCTILCPQQQYTKVWIALHVSVFKCGVTSLFKVTWNGCNCSVVSCGLLCIFLLTNDVEYLFLCVLNPHLYCFVRNLLKSVADTFSKIMKIKLATIISPIIRVSRTMHFWHSATRHVCHFILKTGET